MTNNEHSAPLLEMRGINKSFPGVQALKDARFRSYPGRVTALLGENGAGKSTLMKILCGVYTADSGDIFFKGSKVSFKTTGESSGAGIAMIHQELNLIPRMSIAENLFLGREPVTVYGRIDSKRITREAVSLLEKVHLDLDPGTLVGELSVGMQQMVEIAKSFTVNASLIIMDEPTASLADKDVERLFVLIRRLKDDHKSIVYISHRMNEIFSICDDIVIMRDGSYVSEKETAKTCEAELIQDIVGRKMEEQYPYVPGTPQHKVVEFSGLTGKNCKHNSGAFYAGVTTGLFGLVGSGRTELGRAIFGAYPLDSGDVFMDGNPVRIPSPEAALKQRVVYLSEDRKGDGLVLSLSVSGNTMLSALKEIQGLLFCLDTKKEGTIVDGLIHKLRIKTPSAYQAVKNLSGGNQQKVALARALTVQPRLLLLDEPTRGIDVGAKKEIYDLINELKQSGIAVVMISSDMNEILGVSDRVLVFCEGVITGSLERGEMDSKKIMRYAVNLEQEDR